MSLNQTKVVKPSRPWTIYVIHHSHTDIGYTERQEKIEQFHVDFIRQAVRIADAGHRGEKQEWKPFRWTCETFWAVERFLEQATSEEKALFEQAILRGDIELSGTYLNMTELPDIDLLNRNHSLAQKYAQSFGHQIDSAMTADINGYGWGYASSLIRNQIKHLFSCIHTHHGMYALGRKQMPFWWETPEGERLLVWNGEHYMIGNELGICPNALGKYMIKDEIKHVLMESDERHLEVAEERMNRYLWNLEQEQYPYNFVPVMLSGLGTDNASPNARIAEWIAAWNKEHGTEIRVEQTTLSQFFARLKQEDLSELPVHRGDWPDWWSDGAASTAMHTQMYRDAQRTLRKVKRLDPNAEVVSPAELDDASNALTMYAEHTWGYHSSIGEPWHPQVQMLEIRKQAYASKASELVHRALDKVLLARNGATLYPERALRYEVINTEPGTALQHAALNLDGWEHTMIENGFSVIDETTGAELPYQMKNTHSIVVELTLAPNEARTLQLVPNKDKASSMSQGHMFTTSNTVLIGADGVQDMEDMISTKTDDQGITIKSSSIESKYVRIEWLAGEGITAWIDKTEQRDLLAADRNYAAFSPIYELTPVIDDRDPVQVWSARARMGRNRKGINVQRDVGRLTRVRTLEKGSLYATMELQYEVKGMSYYALFIKVYANKPRVEVSVRLHKDSVWMPENVYVALPFTQGEQSELFVEKAGALVRPWKDQIPGTCLDYSAVQEGLFWRSAADQRVLALSMTDTPLLQLGTLEHSQRYVHTQQSEDLKPETYAWILTNYWETNFKATLGGFYEFRYAVEMLQPASKEQALHALHASTGGFTVHRVNGNSN